MKNTIKQIFHSGKFVTGFVIFLAILLTIIIYPLVVAKDPLAMIGNGNFFKPGTYLSIQDTVNSGKTYKMNVDATASIVESKLTMDNRSMMAEWLEKYGGVDASEIDVTDAEGLIALWEEKYDPNAEQKGLIAAKKKKYQRLDNEIDGILEDVPTIIAEKKNLGPGVDKGWERFRASTASSTSMKKMSLTVRTLFLVQITLVVMF